MDYSDSHIENILLLGLAMLKVFTINIVIVEFKLVI
jgi:hypothetical protein